MTWIFPAFSGIYSRGFGGINCIISSIAFFIRKAEMLLTFLTPFFHTAGW